MTRLLRSRVIGAARDQQPAERQREQRRPAPSQAGRGSAPTSSARRSAGQRRTRARAAARRRRCAQQRAQARAEREMRRQRPASGRSGEVESRQRQRAHWALHPFPGRPAAEREAEQQQRRGPEDARIEACGRASGRGTRPISVGVTMIQPSTPICARRRATDGSPSRASVAGALRRAPRWRPAGRVRRDRARARVMHSPVGSVAPVGAQAAHDLADGGQVQARAVDVLADARFRSRRGSARARFGRAWPRSSPATASRVAMATSRPPRDGKHAARAPRNSAAAPPALRQLTTETVRLVRKSAWPRQDAEAAAGVLGAQRRHTPVFVDDDLERRDDAQPHARAPARRCARAPCARASSRSPTM